MGWGMSRSVRAVAGASAVGAVVAGLCAPGRAQAAGPASARPASSVQRVSTASDGTQADGASGPAAVSADGRYVVFWSAAPNLGAGYFPALLVKDTVTRKLTQVPRPQGYGGGPLAISADGRYVAFSTGTRYPLPYVHDRRTGTTEQVRPKDPPIGGEISDVAGLSADGRHLAYTITNRHGNAPVLLYVRDLDSGTDELLTPAGPSGYPLADGGSLSRDGRVAAYGIRQRGGSGPDTGDVFVRDRDTGEVGQADITHDGSPADGPARLAQLSADGRYAAFTSTATNVVRGGTAAGSHAYVRDLRAGRTWRVAGDGAVAKAVSGDGRWVLVAEGGRLVLVHARSGQRRDVGPGDRAGGGAVDGGGRAVAFASDAADLVPGDTNAAYDVFVRRW